MYHEVLDEQGESWGRGIMQKLLVGMMVMVGCTTFVMQSPAVPNSPSEKFEACNNFFLKPIPSVHQVCLPNCHLGKPFIVHQEVQDGPRFLRELLLDVEYANSASEMFSFQHNGAHIQLHHLKVGQEVQHMDEKAVEMNEFGDVIAEFPISANTFGVSLYCFSAPSLLQATIPLVLTLGQVNVTSNETKTLHSALTAAKLTSGALKHATYKTFPRNTLIAGKHSLPSIGTWSIVNSFALLPKNRMERRKADDRVGYFESTSKTVGDMPQKHRFINRVNIENGSRSIIFHIDPSVPTHLHQGIKNGVHAWRDAFVAAGFQPSIIECLAEGDDAFPSDYDSADVRFNSILWMAQNSDYSISHSFVDPQTGEHLSSKIFIDSGHSRSFYLGWALTTYHEAIDGMDTTDNSVALLEKMVSSKRNLRHGALESMGLLADTIAFPPRQIIDECIASVVAHETGHALGLRHNFVGSTKYTWEELGNKTFTDANGISSSIMDYLALNIHSDKKTTTVCQRNAGEYDTWAIEYGYKVNAATDMLDNPLPFATDEDVDPSHPYVRRFDLGKSPVDYYQDRLQFVQKIRSHINVVSENFNYADPNDWGRLWNVESALLSAVLRSGKNLADFVGGQVFDKSAMSSHSDIPETRFVSRSVQTTALTTIFEILQDHGDIFPSISSSNKYYKRSGSGCTGVEEACLGWEVVDVSSVVLDKVKYPILEALLSKARLNRLMKQNTLNLGEVLSCSFEAIWSFSPSNCPVMLKEQAIQDKELQSHLIDHLVKLYPTVSNQVSEQLLSFFFAFRDHGDSKVKQLGDTDPEYAHWWKNLQKLRSLVQ